MKTRDIEKALKLLESGDPRREPLEKLLQHRTLKWILAEAILGFKTLSVDQIPNGSRYVKAGKSRHLGPVILTIDLVIPKKKKIKGSKVLATERKLVQYVVLTEEELEELLNNASIQNQEKV